MIWLASFLSLSAPVAQADDYGCTVLLCLSNPNGPKAVAECVGPINRLYEDLRKGRGFPHCDLAKTPTGSSEAVLGRNYFDDCPAGLQALAAGEYAFQSNKTDQIYQGIGTGEGGAYGQKVCVGRLVGQTSINIYSGDSSETQSVPAGIYDRVTLMNPAASPSYIDVMIDGKRFTRVRY